MVDPGDEPERIRGALEAGGLRVRGDPRHPRAPRSHRSRRSARAFRDVPVYVSRGEASILSDARDRPRVRARADRGVRGRRAAGRRGAAASSRGSRSTCCAVPGHSPAALAFRITDPDGDEAVFVGDVIFAGLGRPHRLPGRRRGRCWSSRSSGCTTHVRARRADPPGPRALDDARAASAPRTRSSTPSEPVERRASSRPARHARLAAGPMRARRRVVEPRARDLRARRLPRGRDAGVRGHRPVRAHSGEGSEVVQKEMYSFQDKGERPAQPAPGADGAARCARTCSTAWRASRSPSSLWTVGACYRYNAVQRGRLREFHQFDAEAIGSVDPATDAELIALQAAWYAEPRHRRAGAAS